MSEPDTLFEQFKNSILKSLKSPSPNTTRKRKLSDFDTDSSSDLDESDIFEPTFKKSRSSNHNNQTDIDEDDEFNELFDIKQPNKPTTTCHHHRGRYFNVDDSDEKEIDPMEITDKKPTQRPRNITFKCYNCDESGHIARNCPYETIEICFKCGQSGHSGFYCENNICSLCLKSHPIHECNLFVPNKNIFRFCIRCGSKEHYVNHCDVLLTHRLTSLQCFVCGKYGHLNCKTFSNQYQAKRIQLCSNCGDEGHTVYFCKHLKMNKAEIAIGLTTAPNEPNICFHCNGAGHVARNCPLVIRQKQQRKKINKHKFRYRANSNSTSTSKLSSKLKQKQLNHNQKRTSKKNKTEIDLIQQRNPPFLKMHDF